MKGRKQRTTIARKSAPSTMKTQKQTQGGHHLAARAGVAPAPVPLKRPQRQFFAMAVAHLALAVLMFAFPKASTRLAFGMNALQIRSQHLTLFKLYGASIFSSASMGFALSYLAGKNMLHTWSGDVLKIGLLAHTLASTFLMFTYTHLMTPLALMLEGGAVVYTALVSASHLIRTHANRHRIPDEARRMTRRLFRMQTSWTPASVMGDLYGLLALVMAAMGVSIFMFPSYTLKHVVGHDCGTSCHLMWNYVGIGACSTIFPAMMVRYTTCLR